MDIWVQKAQLWVNKTYSGVTGYVPCPEDGQTSWAVMYSLTRALQRELGITSLSDNFGTGTLAAVERLGGVSKATGNKNIRTIVEAALYCKGYPGGSINGDWGSSTQAGAADLLENMGLPSSNPGDNRLTPKQVKALLTMDAYVLTYGGDPTVRRVQRWLNGAYAHRRDFFIIPCDGFFSRDVQKGLMLAVQYAIGMADGVANGNFGPGTRDGLRAKAQLSVGATDQMAAPWVSLFKAALVFNRRQGAEWGDKTYTTATARITRGFQDFCRLPTSGDGDYATWCSLLVSTGDPDRRGKAADCMTPLNSARAGAIKQAGYETVGRYITGGTQKVLTQSEIKVIFDAGLTFFPIYQEYNNALKYFSEAQGRTQGQAAHTNATRLGIPSNTTIYFAVDFDALEGEVRGYIIPFFKGVYDALQTAGGRYLVGIYASRRICTLVSEAGYASASFVSGMSSGFSGNLGYPLPTNWSFDQVATLTLASGTSGQIEIDNNIKSNLDRGVASLTRPIDPTDAFLTWVRFIEARAGEWVAQKKTGTKQGLTAQYMATYIDNRYIELTGSSVVFGDFDQAFLDYVDNAAGRPDPGVLRCPKTDVTSDVQHVGAALMGTLKHTFHVDKSQVCLGDFGGWAGDVTSIVAEAWNSGVSDAGAYAWVYEKVGSGLLSMSHEDCVADIDAMVVGLRVKSNANLAISYLLQSGYASRGGAVDRYNEFVAARFIDRTTMTRAFVNVFTPSEDAAFVAVRGGFWAQETFEAVGVSMLSRPQFFNNACRAAADKIWNRFIA